MLQPNIAALLAFSDAMLTFIYIYMYKNVKYILFHDIFHDIYLHYARKRVPKTTPNTSAQHIWAFSCKSSPIACAWCREQFFAQKRSHRWEGSSGARESLLGSPGTSSWWGYLEAEIWLRFPYTGAPYSGITPRQIGEKLLNFSLTQTGLLWEPLHAQRLQSTSGITRSSWGTPGHISSHQQWT